MAEFPTIAVIGGGFSGTVLAIHLLRLATVPILIRVIEPRSELGQGIAYGTNSDCHLLNVPACSVSLFEDNPDDFWQWAAAAVPHLSVMPDSFLPRRLYARYVQSVLQNTAETSVARVIHHQCEAIAIRESPTVIDRDVNHPLQIELADGSNVAVDYGALALGNFPARRSRLAETTLNSSPCYVADAWSGWDFRQIEPHDSVALIGTGLTAVDVVMQLYQQGHQGQIHLISRRGLLPQSHKLDVPQCPHLHWEEIPKTARSYVRHVRRMVESAIATGGDWRSVIDALRPDTQKLWQALPVQEQQRLLRHALPYWSIHRHRIAPSVAAILDSLMRSHRIQVHAGRIQRYHPISGGVIVELQPRHQSHLVQFTTSWIINCTGPETNYRQVLQPFVMELLHRGQASPHPLNLGLNVAADGALINRAGIPSDYLYTLGPPCQGQRWETTAIPEIRQQAQQLAAKLVATASAPAKQLWVSSLR